VDSTAIAQGLRDRLLLNDALQDHQRPPTDVDWTVWVLLAGRGAGKSFAGMSWLNEKCKRWSGVRARIVAPTFGDGVSSCVDGPNGLLTLSGGAARWSPSNPGGACVIYPNGSRVWVVGTPTPREVDRLRALTNIDFDVFEEAFANPMLQAAWDQARLSRRSMIHKPQVVVTSTPRPHPIIDKWKDDDRVVISRAITADNKYLDPEWIEELEKTYKGTRLYRQEVLGEVVDDVEGALWKMIDIERSMYHGDREDLVEKQIGTVVVGVDPPTGAGTCGIVVVGRDDAGMLYVLDDYSVQEATPNQWATRVAAASAEYGGLIVAEINQGGQMVKEVLRQSAPDLAITTVNATKGKKVRAEPVAQRWEAEHQTAFLAPSHPERLGKLIDQMTGWVPGEGESPDRVDALVWACTYLKTGMTATIRPPDAEVRSIRRGDENAFRAVLRGGFPDRRIR
jgi:phage terminase large subunit-like protein